MRGMPESKYEVRIECGSNENLARSLAERINDLYRTEEDIVCKVCIIDAENGK